MTQPTIQSMSNETRSFTPPAAVTKRAWIKSREEYQKLYTQSIEQPETFWSDIANTFVWFKKWDRVRSYDFAKTINITWFEGAKTNMTVNCLDRHVDAGLGDRVAYLWEGNDPREKKTVTYRQLLEDTCRFANVLKTLGVKKGDRVTIYLPMIPELPVAMLACARIGAVHSVIFGGFSAESIADRLIDAGSTFLITSDGGYRGPKSISLKRIADEAMATAATKGTTVTTCVVVKRTNEAVEWKSDRDHWWQELLSTANTTCEPASMDAEDPLFILYTSGSTGKPKGVLHTTAGYMVFAATTHKYVFDYHPEDIFWCTADIGWVTGHSYIVYGPLANAATSVLFEGIPTYPEPDRFWEVCEKYKVNTFYTAPTAIRTLMREGEKWPKSRDLSSLRILGTVGEPINPEAWMWYHRVVGNERCPIVDTWWQTETGGILITPLPGAIATKPGSATVPFFGVQPKIIREDGSEANVNEGGFLVITEPWPGMMRTVYGHHERFKETYFARFPGNYFTGDGARRDEDGYFWLMGRVDDVINVSGHRIGTAEVESALVSNPNVAEAAVVGFPHDIKGEGLYAYVTVKQGVAIDGDLRTELLKHVRREIGPIAQPDMIHFTDGLPKTRSGKIMRRILRKIAAGNTEDLGDTSTLADPNVVNLLLETRPNR
ncbi:MAG: acetate--CoA ligase [Deltaproteobacteria bacterium]|nr:acetate--CoA ligase [Deltaproteobacteria bacterium]